MRQWQGSRTAILWRFVILFATLGFLGPLAILLMNATAGVNDTTYQLAFLLWPAQMLGAYETTIGHARALAIALTANVVVFSCIGTLLGFWSVTRTRAVVSYLVIAGAVLGWALWGAGFDVQFLNIPGLLIAFAVYAIPFLCFAPMASA